MRRALFTLALVLAAGIRKHRSPFPLVLGLVGTGCLGYAMYVNYSALVELAGFLVLGIATWMDFDRRRWARVPGGKKALKQRQRDAGPRDLASA